MYTIFCLENHTVILRLSGMARALRKNDNNTPIKGLLFCSEFRSANGYGELCLNLAKHLSKLTDVSIATPPIYHDAIRSVGLGHKIVGCYGDRYTNVNAVLQIHPPEDPHFKIWANHRVFLTMWESSKLRAADLSFMQKQDLILSPNTYNAQQFREATGRPSEAVYAGCDKTIYREDVEAFTGRMRDADRPFVFGAAADLRHCSPRKGFDRILRWFAEAFANGENVRLSLKANNQPGKNFKTQDKRISFVFEDSSSEDCAAWLRSLDCYIDGSTFEGWGLWTHAAMATGRPVIGTNYSARNDYFQFGNHIPIGYQLAPSQGMFTGLGHWAMPNHSDAVKAMRWAYNNRARCVEIAEEAAKTTRHLTWQAMAENVYKAMRKHRIRV